MEAGYNLARFLFIRELRMMGKAPSYDRQNASFIDYEQRVRLWSQSAEVDPSKRPSPLILRMNTIARQVCLNAGDYGFTLGGGSGGHLKVPRNYFQPDALDDVYRQVAKLSQNARADRTTERYPSEFDVLRRKAEARLVMGRAFPDAFASNLRMESAALSKREKSLLLASVHGVVGFPYCGEADAPLL